jgi:GntR family transcriptional regulator, arabinose operon transcriptional repressor
VMNKVSDIIISQSSFVSLHVQLHNQLRHLILSGQWQSGSRIPSESEFTRHLRISRSTIRLALQQAELEGLIERFAGRGTFVAYRSDRKQLGQLVAFITQRFDSDSLLLILKGAEEEARLRGYQIILSTVQSQEEEIEALKRLNAEKIAGILIWPDASASRNTPENEQTYGAITQPVVSIDRKIHGIDCDCVTSDHYMGARALVQHLIELGHRHIVFLTHHQVHLLSVKERYRAYREVLQQYGLTPAAPWLLGDRDIEISASYAFRASLGLNSAELQQIKDYLRTTQPCPTAIFALNDYLAIIALRVMKLLNISVPNTMSIAGFDDIDLAAHLEVPLTTVAQDHFTIGKHAARRLFDRLEGYSGTGVTELIPAQLRVRHSTSVPVYS